MLPRLFGVLLSPLLCQIAQALVSDVPSLNGPVPFVPWTEGSKKRTSEFVHPGLWHSHQDLERIRTNSLSGVEPWASAYKLFANDSYSLSSYKMRGPYAVLSRGSISNYTTFADDTRAAYQNAIMWYITKDQAHWNVATTILDAWGTNLTNIIGTDRSLLVGLVGPHLANAAEIMRWEGGWVEQGSKWQGGQGFSIQLYWLFARQSVILGQANYGFASIGALLNFAVYLDDVSLWNYALYAYKNDYCAGIPGIIDERTGQSSESGRDQSHVQSALGWVALAARVGKNQGIDLFKYNNNLLFKGAEYSAKYNLNQSVPYDPSYFRCEAVLVNGPWKEIANISRGVGLLGTNKTPAVWSLLHYAAVERGIKAPWTAKAKEAYDAVGGEVRSTNPDLPSWGDLLFAAKPGRN